MDRYKLSIDQFSVTVHFDFIMWDVQISTDRDKVRKLMTVWGESRIRLISGIFYV